MSGKMVPVLTPTGRTKQIPAECVGCGYQGRDGNAAECQIVYNMDRECGRAGGCRVKRGRAEENE